MSLNKCFVMGRMVEDPVLRSTQNGVNVTTFRIACERDIKNKDGERETDFITVVAWRQTAEFVATNFSKGRMVVVVGRLQMRQYIDKEENKRTISEIVAENVYFGDSKKDAASSGSGDMDRGHETPANNAFEELSEGDGELPF